MDAPVQISFRLRSRLGRDGGQVTWDPVRRELRGGGLAADMLRDALDEARRTGRLATPAGPIDVADPYADPAGLADCVAQHWELPPELVPHMVRRAKAAEPETDLQLLY